MTIKKEPLRASSKEKNIFSGAPSFSFKNRMIRVLWMLSWTLLASWTPPPLHGWRIILLRLFGAKVGVGCKVYRTCKIWYPPHLELHDFSIVGPRTNLYNQGKIIIEEKAIISQGAYLCTGTHDISDPNFQLETRDISIGTRAWVAADAFVGPGVKVGQGTVLAARAAAFKDLDDWTVYRGNPAISIKKRILKDI
ncbi:acetyltransferase [Celeribacter halophilus]|uniref:acetyltransferase n=1 Tax=Celeribacter halophilus TaxID=576117 RepID=UPI003A8E0C60